MSRPRTISDAEILAAAARVIGKVGPARLTLALVAEASGLSAPTLVQRFGSKRALLLRLAECAVGDSRAQATQAREATASPLAAARRFLLGMAGMATTPREMAHHLAFLQLDLTDPDFHRLARAHALEQARQLAALLSQAMAGGELRAGDAAGLAGVCLSVANGALLRWAIVRRGKASAWLATDLDAVLASWRPSEASGDRVTPSRHTRRTRRRV